MTSFEEDAKDEVRISARERLSAGTRVGRKFGVEVFENTIRQSEVVGVHGYRD
jgi:hypothetical protein